MSTLGWTITAAALHLGASGGLILGVLWAEARSLKGTHHDHER